MIGEDAVDIPGRVVAAGLAGAVGFREWLWIECDRDAHRRQFEEVQTQKGNPKRKQRKNKTCCTTLKASTRSRSNNQKSVGAPRNDRK